MEYVHSRHSHVNYSTIPSIVYTYPEAAWVKDMKHKPRGCETRLSKVCKLVEVEPGKASLRARAARCSALEGPGRPDSARRQLKVIHGCPGIH
jgi:hypothetical protein